MLTSVLGRGSEHRFHLELYGLGALGKGSAVNGGQITTAILLIAL